MPVALHVYIVDPGDDTIKVEHIFYGDTEAEAERYREEHLGTCSYYRANEKDGNTIEIVEEIHEADRPEPQDFEEDLETETEEAEPEEENT